MNTHLKGILLFIAINFDIYPPPSEFYSFFHFKASENVSYLTIVTQKNQDRDN
jgi:hypothetical protein